MRIIVKNIPSKITEIKIREHFSSITTKEGKISNLTITDISFPKDTNRNFCFIGFKTQEEAEKALIYFNKSYLKNKKVEIQLFKNDDYKEKREKLDMLLNRKEEKYLNNKYNTFLNSKDVEVLFYPECMTSEDVKDNFGEYIESYSFTKEKFVLHFKDLKSSIEAQKQHKMFMGCRLKFIAYKKEEEVSVKYYSSLFFDFTTIVERICEEEKIKKVDLIDVNDKDLGARIAILESHLVEQTKRWLEENKINVTNNVTIKSFNKKILLIRNFDLLNNLEGLDKANIKVSPSRCIAIAEFKNEMDAEDVYKKFSLKRVNNKAIYCEYLPIEIYKTYNELKEEDQHQLSSTKLIIKNVPFQASKNDIKKIIESQAKVIDIRMPVKRDKSQRGFCFVELENEKYVQIVCEYFGKSTHLFGRRLIFQPAKN